LTLYLISSEDEGIELQVLSSDKKRESQVNDNSLSIDTVEFADFNSIGLKQDTPVTTSGTIGKSLLKARSCSTFEILYFISRFFLLLQI
jgi:hypothetical protein